MDNKGTPHLWLARLDAQLSPRQLSPVEADSPRFGVHGDIFFRGDDTRSPYSLSTEPDGTLRFVVAPAIDNGSGLKIPLTVGQLTFERGEFRALLLKFSFFRCQASHALRIHQ